MEFKNALNIPSQRSMRELSAVALSRLASRDPTYMTDTVLPSLLTYCHSMDLCQRHGAILATAHLTHALARIAWDEKR